MPGNQNNIELPASSMQPSPMPIFYQQQKQQQYTVSFHVKQCTK